MASSSYPGFVSRRWLPVIAIFVVFTVTGARIQTPRRTASSLHILPGEEVEGAGKAKEQREDPATEAARALNLTGTEDEPSEKDKLKEEIKKEVKAEIRAEMKDEIRKEIRRQVDIEVNETKLEKDVEEEIEREVKQDLAEEGIGKEERMSPLGEQVIDDVDEGEKALHDKWTMFLWFAGFIGIVVALFCCLSILAPTIEDRMERRRRMFGAFTGDEPSGASGTETPPVLTPPVIGALGIRPRQQEPLDTPRSSMSIFWLKVGCVLTLVLLPLGVWTVKGGYSNAAVFWTNLLAIVPESYILSYATEELALHCGDVLGSLMNATFGNSVELIFVYFMLRDGLLSATTGSLVGSILSNHLVLLGFVFLFGGIAVQVPFKFRLSLDSRFHARDALDQAQMLLVSSFSVTLPAIFARSQHVTHRHVLVLSQAFSVFLLLSYLALVVYQLQSRRKKDSLEHKEIPTLKGSVALALLAAATVTMAISSKYMVHTLDEFCAEFGLSQTFVGAVLLPVAGDFSHASAVYLAMKDKMDLAINIALASAIQIALVVTPLSVLMGSLMGQPMTIAFDAVQHLSMIISAIITNTILVDGRSNWLRGYTLLVTFLFVCLVMFFMPDAHYQY